MAPYLGRQRISNTSNVKLLPRLNYSRLHGGLVPYLCTGQLAQLQEAPQVQSLPHILDELVVGWLLVVMELAKCLYSIVKAVWAMVEREGSMRGVPRSIYVFLPWYGNQAPRGRPPSVKPP